MGQQNGSEVRSVKLNGFIYKTKFCLTSLLCKVSPSKYFFKPLLGLVWRRPNRFCKMFAPVLLQNATRHAWQKLSGKIVASRRVPKKPPPTKCQSHICVFLKGTLNRDSLNLGGIGYRTEKQELELDTLGSEPRKSETKTWPKKLLPRLTELWGNKTDLKFTI